MTTTIQGHPDRPTQYLASDSVNLFRSDDSGATWQAVKAYPGGELIWCLADPARLYAWRGNGLAVSRDQGVTWTDLTATLASSDASLRNVASGNPSILRFVVSASNPDLVAIRVGGYPRPNSLLSPDGGKTWMFVLDPDAFLSPGDGSIALEPGDAPRLLLMNGSAGVWAHDNDGWKKLGGPPPVVESGARFIYHAGSPPVISVLSFSTAIVSTDYGASWTPLTVCTSDQGPCNLWINPGSPGEWWITGNGVWRSTDSGQSWMVIRDSLGPVRVASLAFTGRGEQPIFASTIPTSDVYLRKLDATWQQMPFASYWGGSADDSLVALLIDSAGRLILVTSTTSQDYPATPDAPQTTVAGRGLGLTRFSVSGDRAEFSSSWGGSSLDQLFRARMVAGDRVIWCGVTTSGNLPNLAEPLLTPLGPFSTNAFAGGFDPSSGNWLPTYSFGGEGSTSARDCDLTSENKLVITGVTDGAGFPLVGTSLPSSGSGKRQFVSVIRPK